MDHTPWRLGRERAEGRPTSKRFLILEIHVSRRERQLRYGGSWGGRWHRSATEMGACFGLQGRVSGLSRGGIGILWRLDIREEHRALLEAEVSDPPNCQAWWLLMPTGREHRSLGIRRGLRSTEAPDLGNSQHIICQYFLSLMRFCLSFLVPWLFSSCPICISIGLHCTLFASFALFASIRVDPGSFPHVHREKYRNGMFSV